MFMLLKARKKCTLELEVRYGDVSSGSEVLGNLFSQSVLEHSTDLSHAQIHIPVVIDNATANLIGILIYVTYTQPYLKNIDIYIPNQVQYIYKIKRWCHSGKFRLLGGYILCCSVDVHFAANILLLHWYLHFETFDVYAFIFSLTIQRKFAYVRSFIWTALWSYWWVFFVERWKGNGRNSSSTCCLCCWCLLCEQGWWPFPMHPFTE